MTNLHPATKAITIYLRHRDIQGASWSDKGWKTMVRKCLPGYLQQVPIEGKVAHWYDGKVAHWSDGKDRQCAAAILIESPAVGVMLIDRIASEIKGSLHPQGINQAAIVVGGMAQYLGGSLSGWRNNITTREDAKVFMLSGSPVYLVIELWTSDLGATPANL